MTTINRPCPSCGSDNVKWRKRRWYDPLLGLLEGFLTILGPSRSSDRVTYSTSTTLPNMVSTLYGQSLTKHAHLSHAHVPGPEKQPGPHAAHLFFRCGDCGSHGKHFEKQRQ